MGDKWRLYSCSVNHSPFVEGIGSHKKWVQEICGLSYCLQKKLNGNIKPLLTCWQDSLLKTVVLCGSLWVSWEYGSAAIDHGVFHKGQVSGQNLPGHWDSFLCWLFNITFMVKMFPSLPCWLWLGGSVGIFAEWTGTGQGTATAMAPLLHSSGRSQHKTFCLQAAPEGRRVRSSSPLPLELLLSAQEPSLGSVS